MSSPHLLAVVDVKPDCAFHAWRRDVHSQKGEDGIIETLMRRIGVETGYFVEFGAWDGRHLSNTAKLADEGWRGCFIEGSAERFPDLVRNYAGNDRVSCLHRFVEASGRTGLTRCLPRSARRRRSTSSRSTLTAMTITSGPGSRRSPRRWS